MMKRRCDSALTLPQPPNLKTTSISAGDDLHGSSSLGSLATAATAAPPQQQQPAHGHDAQRFCLQPAEIYDHVVDGGRAKAANSLLREVVLGFMAGAFISFGFATCMLAAGQFPAEQRHANPGLFNLAFGAYGFPVGLSLCVINGASLFTSNIAYMAASFAERRSSALASLRVVWLSYFSNLAGCLCVMQLMLHGDVFLHREAFTVELALKKTSYSFGATFTKGILCNWLVCMAVWQANAAQDITGKLLGIWMPISAFVTSGYEHCIANMFVIPLGMRLGADISVSQFLTANLIPSTLGNLVGGGVFVAMAMALSFGSWERALSGAGSRLCSRAAAAAAPVVCAACGAVGCAAAACVGAATGPRASSSCGSDDDGGGASLAAAAAAAAAEGHAQHDGSAGGDGGSGAVVPRAIPALAANGGTQASAAPHPAGV